MRKIAVVWFDRNRNKFRVGIGKEQKTHIGRYNNEKTARAVEKAVVKAYRIGYIDATRSDKHDLH